MEKGNNPGVYFLPSVAHKVTEAQVLEMVKSAQVNHGLTVSVRRDALCGLSLDFGESRSREPVLKLPLDISVKV